MGEYVYTVICASICTAIIIGLSPDGEEGIGKYIAFAAALVTALSMISPLSGILKSADLELDIKQNEKADLKGYEYYAEGAATVVTTLYGVERSDLSAKITESDSGELKSLTLVVTDCSFDCEKAERLLYDIYKINIEIEEG